MVQDEKNVCQAGDFLLIPRMIQSRPAENHGYPDDLPCDVG